MTVKRLIYSQFDYYFKTNKKAQKLDYFMTDSRFKNSFISIKIEKIIIFILLTFNKLKNKLKKTLKKACGCKNNV